MIENFIPSNWAAIANLLFSHFYSFSFPGLSTQGLANLTTEESGMFRPLFSASKTHIFHYSLQNSGIYS